jgi:glutamyl-tRNA synthetase
VDEETLLKLTPLLQPRLITLDEVPNWVRFIFVDEVSPEAEDLIPKGLDVDTALEIAQRMLAILEGVEVFTHETIEQPIRNLAEEMSLKLGQVFHVLRMAVAAQPVTPPLIESMDILGKKKTISRLKDGVHLLQELSDGASNE